MEVSKKYFWNKFTEIIPVLIIFYILYCSFYFVTVFFATRNLSVPQNQEFLRVIIYGSSSQGEENTVSGSFSIIDTNGNEIAKIERSWSGNYLELEFNKLTLNGKNFYFPYRIYGKENIIFSDFNHKKAIELPKYYEDDNQCLILGYGSTLKDRNRLYAISRMANRGCHIPVFAFVKTVRIDLSGCKTGIYYSVGLNQEGLLELTE